MGTFLANTTYSIITKGGDGDKVANNKNAAIRVRAVSSASLPIENAEIDVINRETREEIIARTSEKGFASIDISNAPVLIDVIVKYKGQIKAVEEKIPIYPETITVTVFTI